MRRQTATSSGTSTSNLVVFDQYISPFSIGIGTVVTSPATYTIQFTLDDVNPTNGTTYSSASGQWYSAFDTNLVSSTTNAFSSTLTPVTAARINQTAGTGSVVATFIQAGIGVF
jgi:hypothetical protein